MNEDLIGEAVTLEAGGEPDSLALVVNLVRDLLAAADAKPADIEGLEAELRAAYEALRQDHGGSMARLSAELVLVGGGMEVHLQPGSGTSPARTVLCPV